MKNLKKSRSNQLAKKKACPFGVDLMPRCGKYAFIIDLNKFPGLREDLAEGEFPPYCYLFIDDDNVWIDRCLLCLFFKGFSVEAYETISYKLLGITRENYKEKLAIFGFYGPDSVKHMDSLRDELIQEIIKDGIPVDMTERNFPNC